ncbi:hypothetical protein WN944_018798 [Citrus x changshan-huyou]|uniref:Chromo domain-containing protein n=1 Tax=Citrus x changshan-huyou TaxID=2935761 RepID=A0AAP0LYR4_9ROSI
MERDAVIKEVKEMIEEAQARMKRLYDSKHKEREFYVGDMVYLKLQPYRQLSVSMRKIFKLAPKYYGPYKVLQRIGVVGYKLELPLGSRIQYVFHVSLLKKKIGEHIKVQQPLPKMILNKEKIMPMLQTILDRRIRKKKQEVIVHWQWMSPADATWEDRKFIKEQFLEIIFEDKGEF